MTLSKQPTPHTHGLKITILIFWSCWVISQTSIQCVSSDLYVPCQSLRSFAKNERKLQSLIETYPHRLSTGAAAKGAATPGTHPVPVGRSSYSFSVSASRLTANSLNIHVINSIKFSIVVNKKYTGFAIQVFQLYFSTSDCFFSLNIEFMSLNPSEYLSIWNKTETCKKSPAQYCVGCCLLSKQLWSARPLKVSPNTRLATAAL